MEKLKKVMNQIAYAPQTSNLPPTLRSLIPLLSFSSSLYSIAIYFRHLLYRSGLLHRRRLPVPVISVGNLTWGGNGKTPMVEFLARHFSESRIWPLIVTRGYGGGDEVNMLRRQLAGTSSMIGVGANRGEIANALLKKFGIVDFSEAVCISSCGAKKGEMIGFDSEGIGVTILDDGMQHISLCRDVDIVMVNAMMPWGNGCLIPRGPLREPLTALNRADIAVLHHADMVAEQDLKKLESLMHEIKDDTPIFSSAMVPSHYFEVGNSASNLPLEVVNNAMVLCVSAIGSATSFVQAICKMGPRVVDRLDFSDHHIFQKNDIDMIKTKLRDMMKKSDLFPIVVITEKVSVFLLVWMKTSYAQVPFAYQRPDRLKNLRVGHFLDKTSNIFQDYDRDPEILKMLDRCKVLVLCSRFQILPRNGRDTGSFITLLERLLSAEKSWL